MERMAWPTMTLHEACEAMRANQVQVSERAFGQAIIEGRVPIGYGIRNWDSGSNTYMIFRHLFYEWLDRSIGCEAVRIGGEASETQQ